MLRNREGFTLIELLIVVVIIGILAAIALPKFGATREQAYISAMQSDLRNLQTAQEMLYNTGSVGVTGSTDIPQYNYKQTGSITSTTPDADLNFQASNGVTITLGAGGMLAGEGYSATADHAATDISCTLTVGDPSASQSIICSGGT